MIVGPDQGDIKTARDFAVRSGSDCWFPYYPLCTDHCITETYEMVLQCYREMAECYGAEHISLVGFSSGGALPDFEAACKRANVPYTAFARPKMVHCYCMLPVFREAKEDFAKIAEILKQ